MSNALFGDQHTTFVKWLTGNWWKSGPSIAAIQGFPGLGKTAIGEMVVADITGRSAEITTVHFECPDGTSTVLDDLVLTLAEELDAKDDGGVVEDLNDGLDAIGVFRKLLDRPRLIVLDEAQRLMDKTITTPKNEQIGKVLENLSRATTSPGRILLLSNREFGGARWEERADIRTLSPLKPKEAQDYLRTLLAKENRADAVPEDRIADVTSWLGGNPRALHLVASALRRETLDYLIGLAPEAWELRDRHVSPKLLLDFETRVLTRAVSQLDKQTALFLRRIAVFRQPIHRKALKAMATTEIDMEASRDDLVSRYIIELRKGYYHIHSIVRDTVLLQSTVRQRRNVHRLAGDYFARAFCAKRLVGKAEALGARFVEARYHFTQAESENDLRGIAEHFERHLRSQFGFESPIPKDPQELEERIAFLSVLLKDRGPHAMEYHLVRCLLARGRNNDTRLALPHIRRSTGSKSTAWVLRIKVEAELFGTDKAVTLLREGIKVVLPTQNLFSLYHAASEILARDGKADEAVALLREGFEVVPPTQNLVSLYHAASEILARDGKANEAVALLREGFEVVPRTQNLVSLYHAASEILARDGKADEAVALLREGIKVVPRTQNLFSLYHAASEILARDGKADEAVALLREGFEVVPRTQNLVSLYHAASEILARDGKANEAVALLREGFEVVPPTQNLVSLYHAASEILARDGKADEAVALLREGLEVVPRTQNLVSLYQAASEILARDGKADEAVTLLREGIKVVPRTQNLVSLYHAASEILARDGKADEAVTLLREGIKVVLPTQNLVSLYQAASEILARDGKADEAVTLLREGIKVVPRTQNLVSLYHAASEILARDGKADEAVTLLREGIKVVLPTQNLVSLYQAASEILARDGKADEAVTLLCMGHDRIGDRYNGYKLVESAFLVATDIGRFDLTDAFTLSSKQKALANVLSLISRDQFTEAAECANSEVEKAPRYFTLLMQGVFANLACGAIIEARRLIGTWCGEINIDRGSATAWIFALLEILSGNTEAAKRCLDAFSDRVHTDEEVSVETLLGYWIRSCGEFGSALSYQFPRIPSSISGSDHSFARHQYFSSQIYRGAAHAPLEMETSRMEAGTSQITKQGIVSVLVVASEWFSRCGGLSTFNRQFCGALAQAGARVACVLPEASIEEKVAADALSVILVEAPPGTGLSDEQRLISKPRDLEKFVPDFLVGHGRFTGPLAASLQRNHYQSARLIHFVHTAPDEIEPYKVGREDQAGIRAQERTEIEQELCKTADHVVAVGPRLHGRSKTYLDGYENASPPLRFDPGFDVAQFQERKPPEGVPWQVLLLGRAEDVHLKGLDIAVSAVAEADQERSRALPRLELVIRGTKPNEMDKLRKCLKDEISFSRLNIVPRAFTVCDEELKADFRRASLVLMPSRAEGFGLCGVEAIIEGTPVLVSAESGLGQLLWEQLSSEQASRVVVQMDGDDQEIVRRWATAISRMLGDREASFSRASEIRKLLAIENTWRNAVEKLLAEITENVYTTHYSGPIGIL